MSKENQYDDVVKKVLSSYCLEFELVKSLIKTESSFNTRAYRFEPMFYDRYIKNKTRFLKHRFYAQPKIISASYGLCQIMLTTAEEYGFVGIEPEHLYDPEINITIGCKILTNKINKYGLELGILSYNSGRPRKNEPKKEHNYSYLKKIAKHYKHFGGENELILMHV